MSETVEVVIRLPKEFYKQLMENKERFCGSRIYDSIINGTVLPKGHGDLKDVDEIERIWKKGNYVRSALLFAPTVIEADRESVG